MDNIGAGKSGGEEDLTAAQRKSVGINLCGVMQALM